MFGCLKYNTYLCIEIFNINTNFHTAMKRMYFDNYSLQALSELHRYRAVMFSPTV